MPARTSAVHAPALSLPEAAMLPALPLNLILPDRRTYYPMPVHDGGRPVDNAKRGSMAGRAVLTHVKNAPAKRRER